MSNVKHRIFVGHPDRTQAAAETFFMLTQTREYILLETEDQTLIENG